MKTSKKKKVLVCLSGGVDSSVAALLLVGAGYEVTGAYMKQWSDTKGMSGVCSWKEDRRDAIRVAASLGIGCLTLDFEREYREMVVKYMFDEYKKGRTPNPDVYCNKFIKFGFWLKKAKELGFDAIATGHYASIQQSSDGYHLMQAKDAEKDQTYFLHQLSQEQLASTLFPLGDLKKSQVRALAKKHALPTAKKAESMGICFIGEVPMKQFLQQKIQSQPGPIVMSDGRSIGVHEGLPFYTIGQRHGFVQAGGDKPLFVVKKDQKKNLLVVGYEDDPLLHAKTFLVEDTHWIFGQNPDFPLQCQVRMRHRQTLQNVRVESKKKGVVELHFSTPQKAVTPGQFAVFYKQGECLGGGVIA